MPPAVFRPSLPLVLVLERSEAGPLAEARQFISTVGGNASFSRGTGINIPYRTNTVVILLYSATRARDGVCYAAGLGFNSVPDFRQIR